MRVITTKACPVFFEIMADSIELRMSVTSIKRVDPYVKNVLATATHVALYSFNTIRNEWEKTDTEGALFVYNRNGEPFHSIMIMNRLNTDNLIEPVVKDFDYQMQVPFLLYRNSKSRIFGIWFFNREECIRITFLIESLMEGLKDKDDEKSGKKDKNNVDIFSMLSKAQEDFNKTPTKRNESPICTSTPRVPDVTSQSVMDFFAKAGTKTTQKPPVPGNTGENVLQRLMSNPAHSVEHIEKQQRSVTPQDQSVKNTTSDRRSVPLTENETTSPLAFILQGGQMNPEKEEPSPGNVLNSSPFAQFLENSKKPHLMTPMMFTGPGSVLPSEEQPDLLTEKQLAQALIFLLKNNSDFIKQIHEAYVKSIMEKVNTGKKSSF